MNKELFIVEGKSAESTLRQAVDKTHQHVHALQGKLINVQKLSRAAVAINLECKNLLDCLCGKINHNCLSDADCPPDAIPYSKVLILMDPDIDGAHSTALLLSFFERYCQTLIADEMLYIIKAPKYRVDDAIGQSLYVWDDDALHQITNATDNVQSLSTTRYKGIAQFSSDECNELFLHPASRRQFMISAG